MRLCHVVLSVAAFAVSGSAARLSAQAKLQVRLTADPAEATFNACYAPLAGVVYLIRQPGLLQSCLSIGGVRHQQISWNHPGPKGDVGDPGPAGPAGANGSPGDKGPQGAPGPQGAVGDKGPAGEKGLAGDQGPLGDKGPTGDKGASGDPGAVGDKGPVGDQGAVGDRGATGDKGATGDPGPNGEKGPIGDQGAVGEKGTTGDTGPVGEKGPVGDQGPVGDKGPQGDKGLVGIQGPSGTNLPCTDGCVTTPLIADLAVTDAKLSTITASGKIANAATTATSANTANRIVARDAAGDFLAGNVTMSNLLLAAGGQIFHVNSRLFRVGGNIAETASLYLGVGAGPLHQATQNVGLGSGALTFVNVANAPGSTAVGLSALHNLTNGVGNTAIGANAMNQGIFTGGRNTVIGWRAGTGLQNNGPSEPARNIAIGPEAGIGLFAGSNNIIIGNAGINSNQRLHIGTTGTHLRTFVAGIENSAVAGLPVQVLADGQLGVNVSSARFKVGIRDIGDASDALYRLRPVSYRYRRDLDHGRALQYGLIAEEVERVAAYMVARDSTGRPYTVRYDILVPLLVNEVQRRKTQLAALREESAALLRRLEQLEATAKP